ncbi:primase-like DNA-binding domain-containing protein, partial [Desulfosoma caldarium]
QPPEAVTEATEGYRSEMDTIGDFIDECCVVHPTLKAFASDLYKAYELWCKDAGARPYSQRRLGLTLGERGFKRVTFKGHRLWEGIGLQPSVAERVDEEREREWGKGKGKENSYSAALRVVAKGDA